MKFRKPTAIVPKATVMVGIPTYDGTIYADCARSLLHAQMLCAAKRIQFVLNVADKYSLVQYARNRIAQDFLDDKAFTHLFWVDSDVGFDAHAFPRLIEHGLDVVAGAYPTKSFPMQFPVEPVGEITDNFLQRANVVPTGFLCVSRKAMEAVAETVPTYTHYFEGRELETKHIFDLVLEDKRDEPGKKLLIGEDVVLCRRLVELGFEIWLDTDISFTHNGPNRWGANLKQRRDLEAQQTPQSRVLRDQIAALVDHADAPAEILGTLAKVASK